MSDRLSDPSAYIQHRAPILCIDRIVDSGGDWIVCEQQVEPGPHVLGGELWEGGVVEGLSQTAGVLNGLNAGGALGPAHRGMLVGLRDLKIERLPRVGERVCYRIDLIKRLTPVTLMRGKATVDGEVIATGQLKFYTESEQ